MIEADILQLVAAYVSAQPSYPQQTKAFLKHFLYLKTMLGLIEE